MAAFEYYIRHEGGTTSWTHFGMQRHYTCDGRFVAVWKPCNVTGLVYSINLITLSYFSLRKIDKRQVKSLPLKALLSAACRALSALWLSQEKEGKVEEIAWISQEKNVRQQRERKSGTIATFTRSGRSASRDLVCLSRPDWSHLHLVLPWM